ncbi:hypothetical protein ACFX2I_015724 [Malus domestica]
MARFNNVVLGPNGIPLGGLDWGAIPCIVSGQIFCVFSQNQLVLYFASELRKNIESSEGFIQEEELDKMEGSVATAIVGRTMMNCGDLSRRFSGRPSPKRDCRTIPAIDLKIYSDAEEYRKLREASETWGCFRPANHIISPALMSEMKSVVRSLLDLPMEIKKQNKDVI